MKSTKLFRSYHLNTRVPRNWGRTVTERQIQGTLGFNVTGNQNFFVWQITASHKYSVYASFSTLNPSCRVFCFFSFCASFSKIQMSKDEHERLKLCQCIWSRTCLQWLWNLFNCANSPGLGKESQSICKAFSLAWQRDRYRRS